MRLRNLARSGGLLRRSGEREGKALSARSAPSLAGERATLEPSKGGDARRYVGSV